MADAFTYHFDWDPAKAAENLTSHGVSFRLATTVFRDALALTVYDDEHSQTEERWASIGHAENGQTLVVIHTHEALGPAEARIRIISARTAERSEIADYESTPR
jgi:uncharacterized DUF497 family protein